jgi:para-nitrobenzyl esterase
VFRNVPFAAPPFGPRRFQPPVAPESWDGIRDASASGPGAPQPRMDAVDEVDSKYFYPAVTGEDCLTLEVWTPDVGGAGLPVMVWIHGGGYMIGAGSAPGYSGRAFAREGVVHVAINYRVGFDGFVYLGEGTDNLGLRDQVAGLEWVQRNIAAFGGDPSNVTTFGQSGGAVSVMDLMAMPSAKGLFARAIAMSGSPLGSGSKAFMISPYRAVHGTPSLPEAPMVVAAASPGVPLMAGTNRNETVGFLKALGRLDRINPFVGGLFKRLMGANGAIQDAYRKGPRHVTNTLAVVEAVWTDWGFRMPTPSLIEARLKVAPSVPTWLYEFRWDSPAFPPNLGAFHSIEAAFVRDDLALLQALEGAELWLGTNPPLTAAAPC